MGEIEAQEPIKISYVPLNSRVVSVEVVIILSFVICILSIGFNGGENIAEFEDEACKAVTKYTQCLAVSIHCHYSASFSTHHNAEF